MDDVTADLLGVIDAEGRSSDLLSRLRYLTEVLRVTQREIAACEKAAIEAGYSVTAVAHARGIARQVMSRRAQKFAVLTRKDLP
jgi:Holliday junction resolvasome RuvABC endonuclease subunit